MKFKKVYIIDYCKKNTDLFKPYKNIERLTIEEELVSAKESFKKYFLCKDHNGKEIIKSGVVLEYGYKQMPDGTYAPTHKKNVFAMQLEENIQFAASDGELNHRMEGDYVVIFEDKFFGMDKADFERIYECTNNSKRRTRISTLERV